MANLTGQALAMVLAFSFASMPAANAAARNTFQATVISAPINLPEVPGYRGRVKFEEGSYYANASGGPQTRMRFESKDTASAVLDFYRMYLPQYNWTITSDPSNNSNLFAVNNVTGNTLTLIIESQTVKNLNTTCKYMVAYRYNSQKIAYNSSK